MDIEEVLRFDGELALQINGPHEFENLGTLLSGGDSLLTYCTSSTHLGTALSKRNVVAAFVRREHAMAADADISFVFSNHPDTDFFLFHNYLIENTEFYGVDTPTRISGSAEIHPTAIVAEKNVEIADDVNICANAVVMENTIIRNGVYVGPGTVVGIDGTQTVEHAGRKFFRIDHAGGVLIDENTFVGANSVVVRSVFREYTTVERNVTIGNLVNIGHACTIGDDVIVLSGAIVCGNTVVARGTRISPGAVVGSSRKIGESAFVTLGAVVTKDVEDRQRVSGNFAIEHERLLKHVKELSRS